MICLITIIEEGTVKSNILVLFGGVSCEHDISIITAYQVKMNIDEDLFDVKYVYICKDGKWRLIEKFDSIENIYEIASNSKEVILTPSDNILYVKKHGAYRSLNCVDCVINCMHGVRGEDGCISALCNLNNVPYTSSDILGSVIGLNKCAFKTYLSSTEIPTIKGVGISREEYFVDVQKIAKKIEKQIGFPCIIKPSRLGSSIGIKVCKNLHDLPTFLENALKFDKNVIVEKYLQNIREYNIAVYNSKNGLRVSSIESPKSKDEILSFNNKYISDKSNSACYVNRNKSEKVSKHMKENISKYAISCYELLQLKGVVRFDFIYDCDEEKLYLNEINTIPGSLANYLFSNLDLDFQEQLSEQIEFAIHSNFLDSKLISHFDSSVLENVDLNALRKFK